MESNTNNGEEMNSLTALETRTAELTEQQVVDGLEMLQSLYGKMHNGKWGDAEKRVRATLLWALEDVHGWTEYRTDLLESELFFDAASVANVKAMMAAGVYA
jgi:hypothetical protein